MYKNYLAYVILYFLLNSCGGSEEPRPGKIEGIVYDNQTKEAISNVKVSIDGQNKIVDTDGTGYFNFDPVPPSSTDRYTLNFSNDNYDSDSKIVTVDDNERASVEMYLNPLLPLLFLTSDHLDFNDNTNTQGFNISNEGKGILLWNISENVDWITVNPTSGEVLPSDQISITVTVDRDKLNQGSHNQSIFVNSTNGGNDIITISLTVPSILEIEPSDIYIDNNESSESFSIRNRKSGNINYSITADKDWITVSPDKGSVGNETDPITVIVNKAGLSSGDYTGLVFINSSSGSEQVTVHVKVE